MTADLMKAIDFALADQWDAAHRLVQQHDDDRTASWIHAVLHKIEGDADNSRYWYRRAGKLDCFERPAVEELQAIKASLLGESP